PPQVTKTPRTSATGSRPKAADYDNVTQEVLTLAQKIYRCMICAQEGFPDHTAKTTLARSAWAESIKQTGIDLHLTPGLAKLITARGSQVRGELKTKTRPLVEAFYRFESGENRKIIKSNREIAERLKDGRGFVYKVLRNNGNEKQGLYQAKIFQKVVNTMWFHNRQDEGVAFPEYFRPFPLHGLAMVITVVECCIDEWITGIRTDINFSGLEYGHIYEGHVASLQAFQRRAGNLGIIDNICIKLHNRGWFHAGAQPITAVKELPISDAAMDAAIAEYKDDPNTETEAE
ncbi:hypothetical protein BD779DRAFT_1411476, partial [Infundibulicybe gibba]